MTTVTTCKRSSRAPERRAARPEKIDSHQGYSIDESCAAMDMGRQSLYNLINAGKIRVVKLDGRPRIPGSEIIRLMTPA